MQVSTCIYTVSGSKPQHRACAARARRGGGGGSQGGGGKGAQQGFEVTVQRMQRRHGSAPLQWVQHVLAHVMYQLHVRPLFTCDVFVQSAQHALGYWTGIKLPSAPCTACMPA